MVDEQLAVLNRGFNDGLLLARQVLEARPGAAVAVLVDDACTAVTASVSEVSLDVDIGRYGAVFALVARGDKPKDVPQTFTDCGAAIAAWVASIEEIESMP